MADKEKYYYLKLKDNFFDSDAMIILESMPDGYLYSNILLKLYLRSLKFKGKLMFNERIPYNPTVLAQVTRHNVGVIEKALKIFQDLGLIDILDNGAIYMLDIQNFIGKSSTEADRKRLYRQEIDNEKQLLIAGDGQMSTECPDKTTPEIEREREIERKKEKEIERKKEIDIFFETIWKAYPRKEGKAQVSVKKKKELFDIGLGEMLRTIDRYLKAKEGVELKYIKQGSTFFNSGYVDYLDSEYEEANAEEKNINIPQKSGYEGRGN